MGRRVARCRTLRSCVGAAPVGGRFGRVKASGVALVKRFGGVPDGCDPFSAGWAGWGEGARGNGTLSPNGPGPVGLPG